MVPTGRGGWRGSGAARGRQRTKDSANHTTSSQPCQQFIRGHCRYGAGCKFSHDKTATINHSSSGTQAADDREAYFDFKRYLKRSSSSFSGRNGRSLSNIWPQALLVLNGSSREWQMSIARDLADDTSGGPNAILDTIRLCGSGDASSLSETTKHFLEVVTHDCLIYCISVESYMGTVYRLIAGANGEQAISFFTQVLQRLTRSSQMECSSTLPHVALAFYEVLRRERKVLLHEGLPSVFDMLENLTTQWNTAGVESAELQSVSLRVNMMRRMSAIERDRLVLPLTEITSTELSPRIRSTFPEQLKIPGGNHDNDHSDIGKVQIFPTLQEIMCTDKAEFLPTTDFTQPHFLSDPVRRHLDAAFRLLRHDIFGPLKDVVGMLLSQENLVEANSASPSIGGNTRVYAYGRANVVHVKIQPKFGLEADISFAKPAQLRACKSASDERRFWQESSRLDEGGLLAYVSSIGGVRAFLLLIVTRKNTGEVVDRGGRNPSLVSKDLPPAVTVKLASETPSQVLLLNQLYVKKQHGLLVELPRLMPETFVPILENLQRMMRDGNLAFQKWILPPPSGETPGEGDNSVPPPAYARRPGFKFRLDSITPDKRSRLTIDPAMPGNADLDSIQSATGLDLGQCRALVAGLTREYALLQGPPGTGKSHVGVKLVRVILDHKAQGKLGPIIVICYTNHALDQFLKHLLNVGIDRIIRIGGQSRAEELDGKNLRVVRLAEQKTSVESRIVGSAYSELEECLMSAGGRLKPIHAARKQHLHWDTIRPFLVRNYPKILRQLEPEDQDGFTLVGTDPLKMWLGKLETESTRDIEVLQRQADRDITSLHHGERWALAMSWADEMVNQASDGLFDRLDYAKKYRKNIDDVHADTDRRTLLKADVVGVTTTGLARNIHTLRRLRSKVIICEEAGEILEAHLLNALMPGVEHFVQIGDHQQLRPQINNFLKFSLESREGQSYQLDRSQFERRAVGEPGLKALEVATLDVQRRMRPEISDLIKGVYPNLKDHDSVHNRSNVVGMRDNLFWLDHNHPEDSRDDGARVMSHSNSWEVSMATALVRHLVRQGEYKSADIALLTPYTGQLQKLRAALSKDFEVVLSDRDLEKMADDGFEMAPGTEPTKALEKKTLSQCIRLATVDNYQGEESSCCILSLVRSNEQCKVGFLKTVNRITVALSRAKEGSYIIGNAKTYREVPMWNDVLQKLSTAGRVGQSIRLCCPRHPEDDRAVCSEPEDFQKYSPEGGCTLICDKRLNPCGHRCPAPCHSDALHQVFRCLQPCPRLRTTCQHGCPKLCGEQCGPCQFKLDDVGLPCGHKIDGVACYKTQDLDSIYCPRPVQKVVPGDCGHTVTVVCSTAVDSEDFRCPTKCDALLPCGHKCPGSCGECRRKPEDDADAGVVTYIHQTCRQVCNRPHGTCTHRCRAKCHDGTPCGSCSQRCDVKCSHSRCGEACHKPCSPCIEKCAWSCEHQGSCSLPCAAPCNRLPCDKRCTLRLRCGHQCPSYCGEECPDGLCQVCCRKDSREARVDMLEFRTYGEIDLDESPIVVLGCKHFFTGETLDGMLGMNEVYATDKTGTYNGLQELSGELSTKVPACPDCRVPIRQFSTKRYNRVVNRAVMDEAHKRFLVDGRQRLRELSKKVARVSKTLTRSRNSFLAPEPAKSGLSNNPVHKKDRYKDADTLRKEAAKLERDMKTEHQPSKKLFDAIVSFQRKKPKNRASGSLEDQVAALTVSDDKFPPHHQPVYNQQVTLEAALLELRIQEIVLSDMFTLATSSSSSSSSSSSNKSRKENGIVPTWTDPAKQTHNFLKSCQKVISQASEARLRRIVIQATLHYARIVQMEGVYRRSRASPPVAAAAAAASPPPDESTTTSREGHTTAEDNTTTNKAPKANRKNHHQQQPDHDVVAKKLLEEALELCRSFAGGGAAAAEYLAEVEEMLRLYSGPRYEEVTLEELAEIKKAMLSGPGGIATHSGHWYNCRNGHSFAIGECGMPMETARCPECGERIGGQNHEALDGVTRATNMED